MRQALIQDPTHLTIVESPAPRLDDSREILVRTVLSCICSGDLMPWYLQKKVGTVLGHEVVGRVETVGTDVNHIQTGDLVFLHHHAPCMKCDFCRQKRYVHCQTWRQSKLDPGGMAELIRVPAINTTHDSFAVNDLTPDVAVFIEPLACCVKAWQRIDALLEKADTGVVLGCGVMGLLNLATCRAFGVQNLIAVEPNDFRRQAAKEYGATAAYSPAESVRHCRSQADFVIVGPGSRDAIELALKLVRNGGVVLLFSPTPPANEIPFDWCDLYFREVSVVPSYSCGPDDTRSAYKLLQQKKVAPASLITHRFSLDEIQIAFDKARQGGSALKVAIAFS